MVEPLRDHIWTAAEWRKAVRKLCKEIRKQLNTPTSVNPRSDEEFYEECVYPLDSKADQDRIMQRMYDAKKVK